MEKPATILSLAVMRKRLRLLDEDRKNVIDISALLKKDPASIQPLVPPQPGLKT